MTDYAASMAPNLQAWYLQTSARYVDLIGDYAGKERFFIEADSLLLEVFSHPDLDFEVGFQLLHAVYLIERYLNNLSKRGCQFDLVSFHSHERNCVPSGSQHAPRYLLARKIVLRHLQANATTINVLQFSSINDPHFQEYVDSSSIYFAACGDGSQYAVSQPKSLLLSSHSTNNAGDTGNKSQLRGMIFQLLHRGLDVALLNGLEWQDSKVFAFVLERRLKTADPAIMSEIAALQQQAEVPDTHPTDQLAAAAVNANASFRAHFYKLTLRSSKDGTPKSACMEHAALLDKTPLSARRFVATRFDEETEKNVGRFIDAFSSQAYVSLDSVQDWDPALVDIFDGRLFRYLLARSGIKSLPDPPVTSATDSANHLAELQIERSSILPFSHPAFDKRLISLQVPIKERPKNQLIGGKIADELTHWHNSRKPLQIKRNIPQDPKDKKKQDRAHQRFMAEMLVYAASLTNANGKSLSPELILVGSSKAIRNGEVTSNPPEMTKSDQRTPSRKTASKSKNEKVVTEMAKRAQDADKAQFASWKRARENIEHAKIPQERFVQAQRYQSDIMARKDAKAIIVEVELYKLSVLIAIWAGYCREAKKAEGQHVAALICETLLELSKSKLECPRDMGKILTNVSAQMGLNIKSASLHEGSRPLSFSFDLPQGISLSIDADPTTFRLLQTGPYMERSMDSKPDNRVSFVPDGWQIKVLDELDASNSILVEAPTSSGKTFISFYAMEKVLRANDDDVVVYVAPTKALVNQVAAEVQARFTKRYKYAGKSVWAIHTRDYRVNNPTSTQILITVPHILQIMLLSPANKLWVPKVKTIIFDEVHTINQADDGVVWEQLLLMAPCQVIALSATIGNPQAFSSWLQTTQFTIGKQLHSIVHEHRFSDLRKFVYDGDPKTFTFAGLPERPLLAPLGLENVRGFEYLHPAESMGKGRLPPDLALESRDCFLLWQAMKKFESSRNPMPTDMEPTAFFSKGSIKKSDIIVWGGRLKSLLVEWMQSSDTAFRQVLNELGKNLQQIHAVTKAELESPVEAGNNSLPSASTDLPARPLSKLLTSTLPLLCSLQSANALPAILFNYNRSACEDIVRYVRDQLMEAENVFKENNLKWKAKVKAFEAWKIAAELRKSKAKPVKSKPGKDDETVSKTDLARDSAGLEDHRFDGFDPLAPVDTFSFADPRKCDRAVLDKFIDYFQWRGIDEKLIDAFQRGIGVHHSGMNRKYRQAVEICFRSGYLTVVVATGTLSLGINMPCKTVVFSGDSVFLTALNFRQASGRAGRRGFDLLGNVVFQDVSTEKACRLLSSRLPDLSGHFPLTTSFILRLFGLLHGTQNAPYALQMVDSLLSQPRLYLGGESFKHQVLHHVRFSIEYLRSQGLVGAKGEPLNLSSCVSHLYFTEKGAFAFHALLREGIFHGLSELMASDEKETLRKLMIIMCNLFGRLPMRATDKESEKELIKRSASVVFLPKMPEEVAEVLENHNRQTLATYELYVKTYVDQYCTNPDMTLPFTKVPITPLEDKTSDFQDNALPPTELCSPFVALSGHGDHFNSISDLCDNVRDGVFLEKAVIPYLDMGDELATPLNAYLYDFFMHGQVKALEVSNRIPRGDVWFVLNDFSLVLATLVASLENFFKTGDMQDLDMSTVGAVAEDIEVDADESEDKSEEQSVKTFGLAESESGTSDSARSSTVLEKKPKRKAKVVDSWDDGGSDDSDEEAAELSEVQAKAAQAAEEEMGELAEKRLRRVLIMFKKLKEEFDGKFRKIFA